MADNIDILINKIQDVICSGKLDDHLKLIEGAISVRRRALAEKEKDAKRAIFRPGDIVRLGNVRPKYLEGVVCTIDSLEWIGRGRTRRYVASVVVNPDQQWKLNGRRFNLKFSVPIEMLTLVS